MLRKSHFGLLNFFVNPAKDKTVYLIFFGLLFAIIIGRLARGDFDFSYFITAGNDFVSSEAPVIVQPGQGYDGQFFYRYAVDPFDAASVKHGVKVDLPSYRYQRIAYPLLAWLFSFGNSSLVPVMLVIVNILAFVGIIYFTGRIINISQGIIAHQIYPLLICGLYMSLARDLSELCELFFFLAAFYNLMRRRYINFALFATMTLLTRETSLLVLMPISAFHFLYSIKAKTKIRELIFLTVPFIIFSLWKLNVMMHTESGETISAAGNIGFPIIGIADGFKLNIQINSIIDAIEMVFWILHFLWQLLLVIIVVRAVFFSGSRSEGEWERLLSAAYLTWFLFALFLSASVYSDDWSFVRVFSLWNMTGFLILILKKVHLSRYFFMYSVLLVLLTVGRLIIRV